MTSIGGAAAGGARGHGAGAAGRVDGRRRRSGHAARRGFPPTGLRRAPARGGGRRRSGTRRSRAGSASAATSASPRASPRTAAWGATGTCSWSLSGRRPRERHADCPGGLRADRSAAGLAARGCLRGRSGAEAWGGERAGTVFRLSSEAVRDGTGGDRSQGARVADATEERTVADAIATLLSVLCIAAGRSAGRCARAGRANRVRACAALALAVQWAIQARYRIVGKRWLVGLRRDLPTVVAVSVGGTLTASLDARPGRPRRRASRPHLGRRLARGRSGLAWVQAGTVAAVAVALNLGVHAVGVLGAAAAVTAVIVALALRREHPHRCLVRERSPSRERRAVSRSACCSPLHSTIRWGSAGSRGRADAGRARRALGGGVPREAPPASRRGADRRRAGARRIALACGRPARWCLPALPRLLRRVVRCSRASGDELRAVDRVLLLAFGVAGFLSTAVALLTAFGWAAAAVASMVAAAGTALGLAHVAHPAGEPVIVGAAVGAAIALTCAAVALSRPALLLAIRLWIV